MIETTKLEQEFDAVLSECVKIHDVPMGEILGYYPGTRSLIACQMQEAIVEHLDTLEPQPTSVEIGKLMRISAAMVAKIRGRIARQLARSAA